MCVSNFRVSELGGTQEKLLFVAFSYAAFGEQKAASPLTFYTGFREQNVYFKSSSPGARRDLGIFLIDCSKNVLGATWLATEATAEVFVFESYLARHRRKATQKFFNYFFVFLVFFLFMCFFFFFLSSPFFLFVFFFLLFQCFFFFRFSLTEEARL